MTNAGPINYIECKTLNVQLLIVQDRRITMT